jgi:hypothetical protein
MKPLQYLKDNMLSNDVVYATVSLDPLDAA